MLIGFTLAILLGVALFGIMAGNVFRSGISSIGVDSQGILNGTTTTYVIEGEDFFMVIDPTMGLITALIIIVGAIALMSFKILGTGIGSTGMKFIGTGIMYGAIWGFISSMALPLINMVPIYGNIFYIILTIFFVIGVIQSISGGGGGGDLV